VNSVNDRAARRFYSIGQQKEVEMGVKQGIDLKKGNDTLQVLQISHRDQKPSLEGSRYYAAVVCLVGG
jgi:hypothetical protein